MGALVNSGRMSTSRWLSLALLTRRAKTRYHCPDYSGPVNARPGTTVLTFACMWLLRKKVNPLWIILASSSSVSLVTLAACWDCKTLYTTGAFWPRFFIWRINDNPDLVLILFIAALLAFAIYDQSSCPAVTAPPCWQFLCSGVVH